ncbi:hypothetical protein KC343_g8248 [Hortaea werneckii]|nr:hypothetical protein KC352_g14273 [Hortaea werneckii]KAI7565225.1 hypothetical protein KC317_g6509 [Hortaea werneckii]KAI7615476.1 hypothetical protein KC346_g6436 [Hortaea werneckii]KAI7620814.1 hypothetical protein KC343_g8248 [Hortaea werneckii]KAI7677922.1 hypothetical protein KC319_g3635 [Hortaea werneckii]
MAPQPSKAGSTNGQNAEDSQNATPRCRQKRRKRSPCGDDPLPDDSRSPRKHRMSRRSQTASQPTAYQSDPDMHVSRNAQQRADRRILGQLDPERVNNVLPQVHRSLSSPDLQDGQGLAYSGKALRRTDVFHGTVQVNLAISRDLYEHSSCIQKSPRNMAHVLPHSQARLSNMLCKPPATEIAFKMIFANLSVHETTEVAKHDMAAADQSPYKVPTSTVNFEQLTQSCCATRPGIIPDALQGLVDVMLRSRPIGKAVFTISLSPFHGINDYFALLALRNMIYSWGKTTCSDDQSLLQTILLIAEIVRECARRQAWDLSLVKAPYGAASLLLPDQYAHASELEPARFLSMPTVTGAFEGLQAGPKLRRRDSVAEFEMDLD